MPRTFRSRDHQPLPPHVLYILLVLLEQERHGYGIIKAIERITEGEVRIGTSTLYAAIRRLLESALLEETDPPAEAESGDPRRRYYRATARGRAALHREASRIRRVDRLLDAAQVLERTGGAVGGS